MALRSVTLSTTLRRNLTTPSKLVFDTRYWMSSRRMMGFFFSSMKPR